MTRPHRLFDITLVRKTAVSPEDSGSCAWVAAEAGAVSAIRRILLKDRGLPCAAANLMGAY